MAGAAAPTVLSTIASTTNANTTSDYFASPQWTDDWNIQSWNNSGDLQDGVAYVLRVNSANNIYIGSCHILHLRIPKLTNL